MKSKYKKSQITMLMIIGLVLFIIVSLVLYLSKYTIKKQSKQNLNEINYAAIDIQPINEFVAKCLDKLAKDAIVLLGKQGGYIYTSQGGTLIDYLSTDEGIFFVKHKNNDGSNINVVYNILPPRFSIGQYSSTIYVYPWLTFPYEDPNTNTQIFKGYFGINIMPPLNSSGGPHSIQTQIEEFIDNNIAICTDFSVFNNQGFDIVMKPSTTSVIIGTSDVSIKSKIPITINNPITNEFAEINDFSSNVQVRLRDIYFFTKELIHNDIEDIKFNISDIKNNKESFKVQLIGNVYSNDDLIIATDEKSLVYGKPFEYIFARKNRAPALYYLSPSEFSFESGRKFEKSSELIEDSKLKGIDPDEDKLTFKIEPLTLDRTFPVVLDKQEIKFMVNVSDSKLSDYQIITVKRI